MARRSSSHQSGPDAARLRRDLLRELAAADKATDRKRRGNIDLVTIIPDTGLLRITGAMRNIVLADSSTNQIAQTDDSVYVGQVVSIRMHSAAGGGSYQINCQGGPDDVGAVILNAAHEGCTLERADTQWYLVQLHGGATYT